MAGQKILVPYNFTAYEEKALDFVISIFGNKKDISVTLFNAYTPLPKIEWQASPELDKMKVAMVSLANELKEKEAGLQSARQYLLENGFSDGQVDYIFRERIHPIADEIISTVSKGHYRIIILCRQPGKAARLFTRSIHNRLLSALKDVTVCIPT